MRLCFGSLFTVMAKRLSSFATNPALCSAMFSTVAQGFEALDPTNVSSYEVEIKFRISVEQYMKIAA